MSKCAFVTVGSTLFDDMIVSVCNHETLDILAEKNYRTLILQIGKGSLPASLMALVSSNHSQESTRNKENTILQQLENKEDAKFTYCSEHGNIALTVFRFRPSIQSEMRSADLIISHAGAGSALEALNLQKTLVTVINDSLMDQHQTELADKLAELRCSVACRPTELCRILVSDEIKDLSSYSTGKPQLLAQYLEDKFKYY